MASGRRLDLERTAYFGDKGERQAVGEMNHEKPFQVPFLVVIKEGWGRWGGLRSFSKLILLLFKGLLLKANILNDREKGIFLGFFPLHLSASLNQEYLNYFKTCNSFF